MMDDVDYNHPQVCKSKVGLKQITVIDEKVTVFLYTLNIDLHVTSKLLQHSFSLSKTNRSSIGVHFASVLEDHSNFKRIQ